MKKTIKTVKCDSLTGAVCAVEQKISLNETLLQLNGAGTKKSLQFKISKCLQKVPLCIAFDKIENFVENCYIILEYNNIPRGTFSRSLKDISDCSDKVQSEALLYAIGKSLDLAFEGLSLADTNYKPTPFYVNNHKHKSAGLYTWTNADERALVAHINIMYKCMLVQHFNYVNVWKQFMPDDDAEIMPTANDIEYSLRIWVKMLKMPQQQTERCIKAFVSKISDNTIANDYNNYACKHCWTVRKWFDGNSNSERFRIYPDDKLIKVYTYGQKDCTFESVVTYDGEYCLKMPNDLRCELQAWYNSNPREFRNEFTALLKTRFCDSVDVNGEEHSFKPFFNQMKKRKVKATPTFDKKHFIDLFKLYPDQQKAITYIKERSK